MKSKGQKTNGKYFLAIRRSSLYSYFRFKCFAPWLSNGKYSPSLFLLGTKDQEFLSQKVNHATREYTYEVFLLVTSYIFFLASYYFFIRKGFVFPRIESKSESEGSLFAFFAENNFCWFSNFFSKGYAGDSTLDLLPTLLMVAKNCVSTRIGAKSVRNRWPSK